MSIPLFMAGPLWTPGGKEISPEEQSMVVRLLYKKNLKKEGLPLGHSEFKRHVGNLAKELGVCPNELKTIMLQLLYELYEELKTAVTTTMAEDTIKKPKKGIETEEHRLG